MKLLRDGKLYIQAYDIYNQGKLPKSISELMPKHIYFIMEEFEEITDETLIAYFGKCNEIVDYDSVSSLTDQELHEMVKDNQEKLNNLKLKYLNGNDNYKEFLNTNEDFQKSLRRLTNVTVSLAMYKDDRGFYKEKVELIESKIEEKNKQVKLVK